MYKQNIPEHARTIRNIHNGLTSGQKLFFGPTRSWGGPCGQAAFKTPVPSIVSPNVFFFKKNVGIKQLVLSAQTELEAHLWICFRYRALLCVSYL